MLPADFTSVLREQYEDPAKLRARSEWFSSGTRLWANVWEQYGFRDGEKVLEVGCGTGRFWSENAHRIPLTIDVTLTDLFPGMLEEARELIARTDFSFLRADATSLPFEPRSFDWILSHFMAYHLTDPQGAVRHWSTLLGRGGRLGVILYSEEGETKDEALEIGLAAARRVDRSELPDCVISLSAERFASMTPASLRLTSRTVTRFETTHDDSRVVFNAVASRAQFAHLRGSQEFARELERSIHLHLAEHGFFRRINFVCHMIFQKNELDRATSELPAEHSPLKLAQTGTITSVRPEDPTWQSLWTMVEHYVVESWPHLLAAEGKDAFMARFREKVLGWINDDRGEALVFRDGESPVGFVLMRPGKLSIPETIHTPDQLQMLEYYIAPPYRCVGWGQFFFERVCARARETGYTYVFGMTDKTHDSAVSYWAKRGFSFDGSRERYLLWKHVGS